MKRILFFIVFLTATLLTVEAQESFAQKSLITEFERGRDLFYQQNYAASTTHMKRYIAANQHATDAIVQEAEYYIAVCAYELKDKKALQILEAYKAKYPLSPMKNKVTYLIGRLRYEKKEYAEVIKIFKTVEVAQLDPSQVDDYYFAYGYSYLMQKQYNGATRCLAPISTPGRKYAVDALYYNAYAEFCQSRYDAALQGFQSINASSKYYESAQYHILQIYDQQGRREEAVQLGAVLLQKYPASQYNTECYRILGENSYFTKNWDEAALYLQRYADKEERVQRSDMYMLGLAYYLTAKYPAAIASLGKVTTETDSLAQNAYIFIGHSYLKQNQAANARMAFQSASKMNVDKKLQEEALYNYALATYESKAPFGESIKAFDRFVSEFPQSEHINDIYTHKTDIYLSEKNYRQALEAIEMVDKITPELRQAKEQALFNLGVEAFNARNYEQAENYFSQSIAEHTQNSFSAQALLWRGETYYRMGQSDKAISDLTKFIDDPCGKTADQLQKTYYTLGYIKFEKSQYNSALPYFKTFLKVQGAASSSLYADVVNRIGDCHYHNRNFSEARAMYNKVPTNSPFADYAAYQNAFILGLQKDYDGKINALTKLAQRYPQSDYLDDALYQIGRTYVIKEENIKAITAYRELQSRCPQSKLTRTATLEIGMVYANMGQNENAIKAYKYVIEKYPSCEETYVALENLQNLYVDLNKVDEYLAYREQIAGTTISNLPKTQEDSISFVAAENAYAKGQYADAIRSLNNYILKFCQHRTLNCIAAEYYLADSYYQTNDKAKALQHYAHLATLEGTPYLETSLLRAAEITYDNNNFASALGYFTDLKSAASNKENRMAARLGMLRCSEKTGTHASTISAAAELIDDPSTSTAIVREARYFRAKAHIALQQTDSALADLQVLAQQIEYQQGAEAAYLYAQHLFDLGNYTEAENQIMTFINTGTSHQYWMARCFVLLADIYSAKSDDFMAKQYLLSLQENYSADDDIADLINARLGMILERESNKVLK